MPKASEKSVLLFFVLAFSFAYRILLMHQTTFPPSADIGLHNSIIYSIISDGKTDFFSNLYQMGGGLSLTFPGYHIFIAFILCMTGLQDFLAHSLVVSSFSTITVACSFLITSKVWGASTGLIVAFLVAVSRFDLEMLLWGGFPNVATLMLVPLTFYLFLSNERFGIFPLLFSATFLSASIYLTHSLSAVVFLVVTFATLLLSFVFSRQLCISKRRVGTLALPLLFGAFLASPFLIDAVPAYLGANRGTIVGEVSDMRQALLSTRVLPLEIVVPLFVCVIFFFIFSREYKGKYLTFPALFLALWVLVPMFFTQGYIVGLYTDYNRFLYYVLLPIIMLIGMGIDHGGGFLARIAGICEAIRNISVEKGKSVSRGWLRLQRQLTPRNVYASSVVTFLLVTFLFVPVFMTPFQGVIVQNFYQVMTAPTFEAIQWTKENTDRDSVFVSDALYGWCLSGFAQRPTLSAVDPQYLTLVREVEPAKAAKLLLDTDFMIDNGLIQIREDGGYLGRHNPMFLAKLNWSYFPYPFFNFNNEDTIVKLAKGDKPRLFSLSQLPVQKMNVESTKGMASIRINRGNDLFNYTQILTVYKNVRFVNMTITLRTTAPDVSLNWIQFNLDTKGEIIRKDRTVGFFDEGAKVLGQLIFSENQPDKTGQELVYTLIGGQEVKIELWASAFSVSDSQRIYENPNTKAVFLDEVMYGNLATYADPIKHVPPSVDLSVNVFDYHKMVQEWGVSYVACRDFQVLPKFCGDPLFSLVFINDEVAIFKVRRSLT